MSRQSPKSHVFETNSEHRRGELVNLKSWLDQSLQKRLDGFRNVAEIV